MWVSAVSTVLERVAAVLVVASTCAIIYVSNCFQLCGMWRICGLVVLLGLHTCHSIIFLKLYNNNWSRTSKEL